MSELLNQRFGIPEIYGKRRAEIQSLCVYRNALDAIKIINKHALNHSLTLFHCDVDFDDGKTASTKLGAINGITSDLNCEDESIAISAKAVNDSLNTVNSELGGLSFYEDPDGNKYVVGADSVPKKLGEPTVITFGDSFTANENTVYTRTKNIGTGFSNVKLGIDYISLLATKEYPTDGSTYANVYPSLSGVSYNSQTGVLSYNFRYTTGTSHIGMDNGVKISMGLIAIYW